jgi:hypothetical protein
VHPVIVQIGRRFYPAARYTEANKRAWQDKMCLVGEMPPLQNRLRGVCYRTDQTDDGWRLLAWFRLRSPCLEWEEAHPFGSHFILLFQSALENWAGEQSEGRPYHRIPMTITELGPANSNQPTEETRNDIE